MPPDKTYKTPGVYVTELDEFPSSITGVETALPAFIGYTEKAEIDGKPAFNQPVKIDSMADYERIFGGLFPAQHSFAEVDAEAAIQAGDFDVSVNDPARDGKATYWRLSEALSPRFQLYAGMRLFYENGGGSCYVVSVGTYAGRGVTYEQLEKGLEAAGKQMGPTLLLIPDAVSLPPNGEEIPWESDGFARLTQKMLAQCGELGDRVAVLDVYGGRCATQKNLGAIIHRFRGDVGDKFLSYGVAYFPFLDTSLFSSSDFTYLNVAAGESRDRLAGVLSRQNADLNNDGRVPPPGEGSARYREVEAKIEAMATDDGSDPDRTRTTNRSLESALPILTDLLSVMAGKNSILPPSSAMAGVYTLVDGNYGVWDSPANVALTSVRAPAFKLDAKQQEDLNAPIDGKAVDTIREVVGRGTVVWGERTLDGNSRDWRYIQVRRTLIYIEQSIKRALDPFVFAANDGKTWTTVISMVSSFLQKIWSQGGLMGASPQEAYSVECGLGSTMTAQDILDGYMIVQVTLQMIRPAEFIELTFKQKMEGVG